MIQEILKQVWGYAAFRPLQEDIIREVIAGNDTLALLPTGGGKSLCFQVPALAKEGVCLVITPLISLMKDQVEELLKRQVPAAAVYSGMSKTEIDHTLDEAVFGHVKFLYLSPERLQTKLVQERVKRMKVCLLAIDEAHCVSQWGHDFRPSYLQIRAFRELLPGVPAIALTATATEPVKADIVKQLGLVSPRIFTQSFARPNLSFSAFETDLKERRILSILQNTAGSGIIYVKTRRRTLEMAEWLKRVGIAAEAYHAGLDTTLRFARQKSWLENKTRIMVATNAFGMGINKPDVRVVIHADAPPNLEAYYQEAGRAGRDGQRSYAVALYTPQEFQEMTHQIERKYPDVQTLRHLYKHLANYLKLAEGAADGQSFGFDLHQFASIFGLVPADAHYGLKLLEQLGFLTLSDAYYSPSKVLFHIDARDLYNFYLANPTLESFIKSLLRIYGGDIYSSYVKISESDIARALYATEYDVRQTLAYLSQANVIDYLPQRHTPVLTFLTYRYDHEKLPIRPEIIAEKKTAELRAFFAVKNYLTAPKQCRMLYLQHYFSDLSNQSCGICDYCITKRKETATVDKQAQYKAKLLEIVPVRADELNRTSFFEDTELLRDVIKQLLQKEILRITELGVLEKRN